MCPIAEMSTHHVGCSAGAGGVGRTQLWEPHKPGFDSWLGQELRLKLISLGLFFHSQWVATPVLHVDVKTEGNYVQQESAEQLCISRHQESGR